MATFSRTFAKYRLLARLGHGGMADVYLSVAGGPGGFNKLQVLKVLRPHLTEQPEFLQMFEDEGRLAARLNHPNIVQTNEIGAEDSRHFIAMEYLDGQPLHRVKQRSKSAEAGLTLEMELLVLSQVLEALEYAHSLTDYDGTPLNIVHRDVTPQNVFVTYAGQTKLVDFGIAKTLESTETQSGVLKGKVAYMAPEQALRDGLDHRADLFSVGVMLWEAVAKRRLYSTRSEVEILHRLIQGDLPRLRDAVPDVSPLLEQLVDRALALKPEQRYQDAASFRADLSRAIDSLGRVESRDVGERVTALFETEREEIAEVIRQEMMDVTGPDAMPAQPETMELPSLSSFSAPGSGTPSSRRADASDPGAPVNLPAEVVTQSAERRWLLPALAGVLLLGVAGLAVLSLSRQDESAEAPATLGSSLPSTQEVRVRVEVSPASAELLLDGKKLGSNPYEGTLPRDDRAHELQISAPGHASRAVQLKLDQNVDLRLELTRLEVSASAPPSAAAPSPADPPSGAPRPATTPQVKAAPSDPFGDLPAARKPTKKGPKLDKSDPWD